VLGEELGELEVPSAVWTKMHKLEQEVQVAQQEWLMEVVTSALLRVELEEISKLGAIISVSMSRDSDNLQKDPCTYRHCNLLVLITLHCGLIYLQSRLLRPDLKVEIS